MLDSQSCEVCVRDQLSPIYDAKQAPHDAGMVFRRERVPDRRCVEPMSHSTPGVHHGSGTLSRHQLVTDAEGIARLRIDTTRFARSDSEFSVEARVVDASRREVVGRGSLRVTRRPWFVFLHPERRVQRVGGVVRVDVRAQDANEQPVAIEGEVTITRERWREIWLDPTGREVSGDELEGLRAELISFPPPQRRGEPPWRLHFRGGAPAKRFS